MPSPKKCKAKFPVGSKAYADCINYKGMTQKPKRPQKPKGGSY